MQDGLPTKLTGGNTEGADSQTQVFVTKRRKDPNRQTDEGSGLPDPGPYGRDRRAVVVLGKCGWFRPLSATVGGGTAKHASGGGPTKGGEGGRHPGGDDSATRWHEA